MYTASPLSYPQLTRIDAALRDKTIRGKKYRLSDELKGFMGGRPQTLYPLDVINFAIADYTDSERNQRKLITEDMFTGEPITDKTFILEQYIKANKKRLEDQNAMKRKIDAAIILGTNPKLIYKEFEERGQGNLFINLMKNKFTPFSSDMKWAHEKALDERRTKGLPNPLDGNAKILSLMEMVMNKAQYLNQPFVIDEEKWIPKKKKIVGDQSSIQTPPLGNTPMPVANNAAMTMAKNQQTNLTRTEEALLSPSEKIIAGRT